MPRPERTPVLDSVHAPPSVAIAFDQMVGVLTHLVLAQVFEMARECSPDELAGLLFDRASAAVAAAMPSNSRRRAAVVRVASLVSSYMQRLAPPPFVVFVGAEQLMGTGRVDLMFDHPTLGLFFDEIKTWKHAMATLDADARAQALRYVAAAQAVGRPFAGVRLLPLASLPDAQLFLPGGRCLPLATTSLSPVQLLAQQASLSAGDMSELPQVAA